MSYTKLILISAIVAMVEARFGQENVPSAAISALKSGGPGEAATLSGSVPGTLLGAANPCAKLQLADKIAALGTDDATLEAAKGLVAAEQNFNPFTAKTPTICGDASLPATEALRGIVPKVDPAVTGADAQNANSAASLKTPFSAAGLSVADVMKAQGFTSFTVGGAAAAGGAAAGGNAKAGNNNNKNANKNNNNNAGAATGAANATANANTGNANTGNNNNNNKNNNNNANANTGAATGGATAGAAAGGAADFGTCKPTIDFQLGRAGRKATEGTFLPSDPVVAKGQQEALNPNIIINRVCDQLGNVCGANAAAKTKCKDAQAKIAASGDKSEAVAATFNGLLGF